MFPFFCSFTQNSSSIVTTEMANNTTFNLPWRTTNDTISNTTTSNMRSSAEVSSFSTHTPTTTATQTPVATTDPRGTTAKLSAGTSGMDVVANTKDRPSSSFSTVTLLIGWLLLSAEVERY